jgi:hypothetical protein
LEYLSSRLSFCPVVVEKLAIALFEEGKEMLNWNKIHEVFFLLSFSSIDFSFGSHFFP